MADDRAVDHQEKGFGDECAEGRNGERDDLAIVPSAAGLGPAVGSGPGCRGDLCHALNLIFHR